MYPDPPRTPDDDLPPLPSEEGGSGNVYGARPATSAARGAAAGGTVYGGGGGSQGDPRDFDHQPGPYDQPRGFQQGGYPPPAGPPQGGVYGGGGGGGYDQRGGYPGDHDGYERGYAPHR